MWTMSPGHFLQSSTEIVDELWGMAEELSTEAAYHYEQKADLPKQLHK